MFCNQASQWIGECILLWFFGDVNGISNSKVVVCRVMSILILQLHRTEIQ